MPAEPEDYDADIVILALNRADETLAAIASAKTQVGCRWRLVVLDQGSAPATLARFEQAIAGQANLSLIQSDRNLGVAGGRNVASALGHGRVIIGLDNDAVFADPHVVARAVSAFDATGDLGAIGFRIVRHDSGEDDLSSWGYPASLLVQAGEAFDSVTFVGAGHAIRRAAWNAAGGYDDKLFFCWEEYDFCLRAIEAGWRIRYMGNIVVRHHVALEARVNWSANRWFYFIRNRLYIGHKTGDGRFVLAARFLVYLMRSLNQGAATQAIRALIAAIRLAANTPGGALSSATHAYLKRNDARHRQSLPDQFLAGLWPQRKPTAPPRPPRAALPAWHR